MKSPITMLSIDWDWFLWRGAEAKDVLIEATLPGAEEPTRVPAIHLFDWGHSENHPPALQAIVWQIRKMSFLNLKLDPNVAAGIREDAGCTPVDTFISALKSRFDNQGPLYLADSHAMGYVAASELRALTRQPIHVVHFDAHHDLGYTDEVKHLDCGSWLFHALQHKAVSQVTWVRPDWLHPDVDLSASHLQPFRDRVRDISWADWLREGVLGKTAPLAGIIGRGCPRLLVLGGRR